MNDNAVLSSDELLIIEKVAGDVLASLGLNYDNLSLHFRLLKCKCKGKIRCDCPPINVEARELIAKAMPAAIYSALTKIGFRRNGDGDDSFIRKGIKSKLSIFIGPELSQNIPSSPSFVTISFTKV